MKIDPAQKRAAEVYNKLIKDRERVDFLENHIMRIQDYKGMKFIFFELPISAKGTETLREAIDAVMEGKWD